MWTVAKEVNVRTTFAIGTQVTPTLGHYSPYTCSFNSLKDYVRKLFRVFNNNTAETNVYWSLAIAQKVSQLRIRIVSRGIAEKETANVFTRGLTNVDILSLFAESTHLCAVPSPSALPPVRGTNSK